MEAFADLQRFTKNIDWQKAISIYAAAAYINKLGVMRSSFTIFLITLLLSGCDTKPPNERYVASRPELDAKTRQAILQHRVILGMFPDEAAAAAGQFTYGVKVDKARWGGSYDTMQVIYAQRSHPDDSEIELNFWTRTQFDTPEPAGFTVVFKHGRAVSVDRIPKKEEGRLGQAEATRIAEAVAVKNGYRLADYRKATANYGFLKEGFWMAFFECNAATPDKNFSVWIDDRTGEVSVEPWEKEKGQ
jgi:hypothetical protein